MAIPFEQHLAATYDKTVESKAANQWSDSTLLKGLEEMGGVKKLSGGTKISVVADYKANPAADFLATDVTPTGTSKTEILTMLQDDWAMLLVPINWSFKDEALNSSGEQRVDLISTLVDNQLATHDQSVEDGLFQTTAVDGFNSLPVLYAENGEGTVHGVVSGTETWFKNQFKDWAGDTGATLLADYTTLYNACCKGSSGKRPNVIVGSSVMHANFEAALVANQRFANTNKASGGFTELQFKTLPYLWSSEAVAADENAFMFSTKDTKLYVCTSAWRTRRKSLDHVNAPMVNQKTWSLLQFMTSNRSRGGVIFS
jgi:hypothetical protein